MKRYLALLLCVVMALGCFSFATAEEKPHLTVWFPMDLRIEDMETNWQTRYLEEQANVDLEFIIQPSGSDYTTKVNMAMTAGKIEDLPDIIIGSFSDTNVLDWALNETIVPLTEYYNDPEKSVNTREAFERTGVEYTKQITSPDGNIYGFANLNQSYYNEFPSKMWVNGEWLAKLGMSLPTTPDELYEVLKATVATDLNGNGKADEIGICGTFGANGKWDGWFDYIMNAYVYAGDGQFRTVDDGVVGLAYTTEEWKEGLKFIKKLFDENLILAESLTMDEKQCEVVLNSEDLSVMFMNYFSPALADVTRKDAYDFVLPLTGPNGVRYATYAPSTASIRMVVTANCKDVEAAFRVGDVCSNELIGIAQRFGEPGKEWDYARDLADLSPYTTTIKNVEMSIVTYHDNVFWAGSEVMNASWRQQGPMVRQYWVANGMATSPDAVDLPALKLGEAAVAYQEGGFAPAEVIPKAIYSADEAEAISEIESNLRNYVWEMTAAFLMGNSDIDADWDSFQAELKNIGSETYIEVVQAVYDRMYK